MSRESIDALHHAWLGELGGRARVNLALAPLDAILADGERLLTGESDAGLRDLLGQRLASYRAERATIAEIHAKGPAVADAWRLVAWSEATNGRYTREYQGQPRPTRDAELLAEMAEEQRAWVAAMPDVDDADLRAALGTMRRYLDVYTAEVAAIRASQAALAPRDQAQAYGAVLSLQTRRYSLHFEGKSRLSRRPALLERVLRGLEAAREGLRAARRAGAPGADVDRNLEVADFRIDHHRTELAHVRAARDAAATEQLAHELGFEAQSLADAYRKEYSGKPRSTRDLQHLSALCDQLQEAVRAMRTLQEERPHPDNARNLVSLLDLLGLAEREWPAIRQARQTAVW